MATEPAVAGGTGGTGGGAGATEVRVDGRLVRLTSLDRVLWPALGLTKAFLVDWYVRVAPVLLPHLRGHPVTLHRFPEGVEGPHFFETRCPPHPPWLRTQRMTTFRRSGKEVHACVLDDVPALVVVANLAAIELHPFLGPAGDLEHPVALVFDLDPGPPAGLAEAAAVALRLRELLDAVGLTSVVKTSGVKGLHVMAPVAPDTAFADTKAFARAAAALLVRERPAAVTDRMAREGRAGKVFVDWSQNDAGKSTVAPYSLRGLPVPFVSTPVTWDEVEAAAAGDAERLVFTPADVLERLDRHGDVFAPALERTRRLPAPPG